MLLGFVDVVHDQVGTFYDGVERCPDLVAHVVDKFRFVLVGLACVVSGLKDFFLHLAEVVAFGGQRLVGILNLGGKFSCPGQQDQQDNDCHKQKSGTGADKRDCALVE